MAQLLPPLWSAVGSDATIALLTSVACPRTLEAIFDRYAVREIGRAAAVVLRCFRNLGLVTLVGGLLSASKKLRVMEHPLLAQVQKGVKRKKGAQTATRRGRNTTKYVQHVPFSLAELIWNLQSGMAVAVI